MDRTFLAEQGLSQEVIEAILARHQQEVAALEFQQALKSAIATSGGRSEKAITALLDLQALQQSKDPASAASAAVAALKKDNAWLFEAPVAAPYAPGTGTGAFQQPEPQSLADALKEKFRK